MGDQATARTRQAILEGLRRHVCERLDASMEREKEANDFLAGAKAVVQAMQAGKIQLPRVCKAEIPRQGLHHASAGVAGDRVSGALVGSSNFTVPGLTENVD
jgi:hypothetical protein